MKAYHLLTDQEKIQQRIDQNRKIELDTAPVLRFQEKKAKQKVHRVIIKETVALDAALRLSNGEGLPEQLVFAIRQFDDTEIISLDKSTRKRDNTYMNNNSTQKRSTKKLAPRFNIFANMGDGKGHQRQTEKPVLVASIPKICAGLLKIGATKPLAIIA